MKQTVHNDIASKEAIHLLPLGAGFVMASSADMRAALGMSAVVFLATLLSAIVISGLRKVIPDRFHLPIYLLIITVFVSIIEAVMVTYFPIVVNMLGAHLAAVAVSAVPYRDAEDVAGSNPERTAVKTALETGLLFTLIMVICALIRETLGSGSLWGVSIPILQDYRVSALSGAVGGYVIFAAVFAALRSIKWRFTAKRKEGTE